MAPTLLPKVLRGDLRNLAILLITNLLNRCRRNCLIFFNDLRLHRILEVCQKLFLLLLIHRSKNLSDFLLARAGLSQALSQKLFVVDGSILCNVRLVDLSKLVWLDHLVLVLLMNSCFLSLGILYILNSLVLALMAGGCQLGHQLTLTDDVLLLRKLLLLLVVLHGI